MHRGEADALCRGGNENDLAADIGHGNLLEMDRVRAFDGHPLDGVEIPGDAQARF